MREIFIKNKKAIVLGTGYSVNTFLKNKEKDTLFRENISFSFQRAFHHLFEKYRIVTDFVTWSDPTSGVSAMSSILQNHEEYRMLNDNISIIIPEYLGASHKKNKDQNMYIGSSLFLRDISVYNIYFELMENMKKLDFVNIFEIPAYTTKQMKTRPDETRDCANIFNNPVERFTINRPIIGTFEYKTDNSFKHHWGRENKLTSYIFPIMSHLGCRSLGVAGFDFGGARFYDEQNEAHAFHPIGHKKSQEDPTLVAVKTWSKDWYEYHNMKIYSLVKDGESGLNEILKS